MTKKETWLERPLAACPHGNAGAAEEGGVSALCSQCREETGDRQHYDEGEFPLATLRPRLGAS